MRACRPSVNHRHYHSSGYEIRGDYLLPVGRTSGQECSIQYGNLKLPAIIALDSVSCAWSLLQIKSPRRCSGIAHVLLDIWFLEFCLTVNLFWRKMDEFQFIIIM